MSLIKNSTLVKYPFRATIDIMLQVFIISSFLYAGYQVFFAFPNPGGGLALFGEAQNLSPDDLFSRRLYAYEFWIVFTSFLVYRGIRKKIWAVLS